MRFLEMEGSTVLGFFVLTPVWVIASGNTGRGVVGDGHTELKSSTAPVKESRAEEMGRGRCGAKGPVSVCPGYL